MHFNNTKTQTGTVGDIDCQALKARYVSIIQIIGQILQQEPIILKTV